MIDQYNFFDNIILRTPLLSFRENLEESDIRDLIEQTQVREAIFLASPNLYARMNEWRNGTLKEGRKEKLVESLYSYLIRMHTRCTPFGLFAGCVAGEWAKETDITLRGKNEIRRHTRLDMNFLCAFAQYLEKKPEIRQHLKYRPNSSLHKKEHFLHYVEYFYQKNVRTHRVNSADLDTYLKAIINKSESGSDMQALCRELVTLDSEIEWEEAEAYVNAIIDAQILVSELEPSITGDGLLCQIIAVLETISKKEESLLPLVELLHKINTKIDDMDSNIINSDTSYKEIIELIKETEVPHDPSKLFQTDSYKVGEVKLDKNIQFQLKRCMQFLEKFPNSGGNSQLTEFINSFYTRYEDREVALLDVLDTQWGIGYPVNNSSGDTNPLTKDIFVPQKKSSARKVKWGDYEDFFLKAILKNNEAPIDLSTLDTSVFEQDNNKLMSDTIYTMFKLVKMI